MTCDSLLLETDQKADVIGTARGQCSVIVIKRAIVYIIKKILDIRESMEKGDKLAILKVHFGSAYPEARTQVLDVMKSVSRRLSQTWKSGRLIAPVA